LALFGIRGNFEGVLRRDRITTLDGQNQASCGQNVN